jgi:hypothetical protein
MPSTAASRTLASIGIDPGSKSSGIAVAITGRGIVYHATVSKPFVFGFADTQIILGLVANCDRIIISLERPFDRLGPVEACSYWKSWARQMIAIWRDKPPIEHQPYILQPFARVWRKGTVLNKAGVDIKAEATKQAIDIIGAHQTLSSHDEAEAILIAVWGLAQRGAWGVAASRGRKARDDEREEHNQLNSGVLGREGRRRRNKKSQ